MSKVKRFSTKGMKNFGYLGRFNKQKFLDDGHNTSIFEQFAELITPFSTAVSSITGTDVLGNQGKPRKQTQAEAASEERRFGNRQRRNKLANRK